MLKSIVLVAFLLLLTIAGVPAPAQAQVFSRRELGHVANYGRQPIPVETGHLAGAVRLQAQYTIPILRVVKRDALDGAG